MDDLPSPLLIDILSRLGDSTDLARCRLASRTFRSLSYGVRSVHVICSRDRFLRSRDPATRHLVLPFKSLVANVTALLSPSLESLSLAVDRPPAADEDDLDESDDLHLTAVDFLSRWLPAVAEKLRSLAISDYWIQSCWRRSDALGVISDICGNLNHLEVRNAWLSVEGLKPMLRLTALTLEFVRLDDEDLDKLSGCFLSLQVLKLIGVGGLKEPKLRLPELRVCHWAVSNYPLSLTLDTPKLVELKLKCVEPKTLVLKAPLLSKLSLKIKKTRGVILADRLIYLESLKMESSDVQGLIRLFTGGKALRKLELEVPESSVDLHETVTFQDLISAFPNMDDLKLGPGAWSQFNKSFKFRYTAIVCKCQKLRSLMVHLPLSDFDFSFISSVLSFCIPSSQVAVLMHHDTSPTVRVHLVSKCTSSFPRIRWKWGVWKESSRDAFLDL